MTASARKNAPRSAPKKPQAGARPRKPVVKATRPVARVSEGARGELAVLANDPDFQKQVAQHIATGVLAQSLLQAIVKIVTDGKWTSPPPLSTEAMQAAAEFLAEVAKHNGPPPSEDELDEMLRSWA